MSQTEKENKLVE
jgi:hypothetical protein